MAQEPSPEQLQAQKRELFGILANGIAHDFNNIVSVIIGYSELLIRDGHCLPDGLPYAVRINEAGRRAAALTRQLSSFARKDVLQIRPCDLNETVSDQLRLLERLVGEGVRVEFKPDPSDPWVMADPQMIEQVLLNLSSNARDAMPKGGVLTLTSAAVAAKGGAYVALAVADTGVGIPPESLARIFEPFFTTKSRGKGVGLGLPTVEHIVRQHSGWIEAASEPGKGSVFTAYFPRANPTSIGENAGSVAAHVVEATRVLVIDDEAPVRELVVRILERQGYLVHSAESGPAGQRVWEEQGGNFEILLTDVVIPGGRSGRELAERFQKERPELKVLYMSGYINSSADLEFVRKVQGNLLQKPFSIERLLEAMGTALQRR